MIDAKGMSSESLLKSISSGDVFVDFYSEACGPCRMMLPFLQQLSEEIKDVSFIKVDAVEHKDLAEQYGVRSVPRFVFMKQGVVVADKQGACPKETVKQFIIESKGA